MSDTTPDTLLATVVVQTSAKAGNLTLTFDPSFVDLEDQNGNPLGPVTLDSYTATARTSSSVPEPASLTIAGALLGLAGVAVAWPAKKARGCCFARVKMI